MLVAFCCARITYQTPTPRRRLPLAFEACGAANGALRRRGLLRRPGRRVSPRVHSQYSLPGPPHGGQHALLSKSIFNSTRDAVERRWEARDDGMLVRRWVRRREHHHPRAFHGDAAGCREGAFIIM